MSEIAVVILVFGVIAFAVSLIAFIADHWWADR